MSNGLTVLGFGQCGSKIAIEISASFNPASVLAVSGELSPLTLSFRAIYERFRPTSNLPRNMPRIYIADLNDANDVYIQYRKIQAIRAMNFQRRLTTEEKIARVNASSPGVELNDQDAALVEYAEKNRYALGVISALYFSTKDREVLRTGGVGGLQHISEVIADQDDKLIGSIHASEHAPLVGVFALGGGTGAGSLYSVLTKYKNQHHRYTIGVGVLPMRSDRPELRNAGRYITKFVGASKRHRFHTLLLFSNEVAIRLLQRTRLPAGQSPLAIVNAYIASFIHAFSLLGDDRTVTLFGKLLDPADCKQYFADVCTIGYAAAASPDEFTPKDVFVRAISPLSFSKDGDISGVAVSTGAANAAGDYVEDERHISETIVKIIDLLDRGQGDGDAHGDIERLRKVGTFYRTTKAVRVLFFLKNRSQEVEVVNLEHVIGAFFRKVAGDGVSVSVNAYLVNDIGRSAVLVVFDGAFCYEMYDSVLSYVRDRFISDDRRRVDFLNSYNEVLSDVRSSMMREEDDGLEGRVDDILDEACGRSRSETFGERPDYLEEESVKSILKARRVKKVTRSAVRSVLVDIARRFRPEAKVPQPERWPFP